MLYYFIVCVFCCRKGWHADAMNHLGLQDRVTEHTADYGHLPDLTKTNPDSDILFTWNGTTSGVKVNAQLSLGLLLCCCVPGAR